MATKRTARTRRPESPAPAQTMGPGAVRDLVKDVVRTALREQARELEQHLNSINERLVALEKR